MKYELLLLLFVPGLAVASSGGPISTTALSRSVALVDPDGDPANPANVASISDSATVNGRTATSLYSRAARTLTTTSPLGRQGTTTFDLFGRVSEALSPGVAPVSSAYDAQGRLSTVTQGSRQTLYTYNAQGLLWKIRNPLLREVEFTYDSVGRVLSQKLPDTRIVQFDYDANGNLTSLTPPGRPQHGFVYDIADQGTVYDPPAAGLPEDRTLFAYNLDHQLELVTRPDGQTIDSVYDLVTGRLTSMVTPRGSYVYSYQPGDGNLASVADPDGGSLAFTYDGSLPKSVTWTGPVAGSLQLGYNSSFELTSRKINNANEVTFGYDLDGLLTQAGALTLTRSATTGLLSGTTLAGATDLFTYTGFGELDTYTARHGATDLYSFDTARDNGGRIATKSETVEGVTHAWEYVYDTAGRLDQVKRDSVVVADYDYDANSNRTAWTDGWGSGTAVYDDQDRLLSYGSKTYTYTANGELATKTDGTDVTTYSYDVLGNLRTVVLPTGVTIDYVIDAANRRVGKKVNGTLVQGFLYQSQLAPAAELDGSGNIVSQFVYATKGNVPDYMVKGGVTYRLFTDHLGSVRLVVNATTGAIAQRIDYDAFGRIQLDTNPGFQPFGFAGGLYDTQTGLTRFGARDFDAETGRWAAKDPIGLQSGDTNSYGYCLLDPVNALDPYGLYSMDELLEDTSNAVAAFGDTISLGATEVARNAVGRWMGTDPSVDKCSTAYTISRAAGTAFDYVAISAGLGAAKNLFVKGGVTLARNANGGAVVRAFASRSEGQSLELLKVKDILRIEAHPTARWMPRSFYRLHGHVDYFGKTIGSLHIPLQEAAAAGVFTASAPNCECR